ncbi:type III-B CRISPR module RAMP protein Cmr1 [Thermoanaerobacter siderophilus]|uniref:CRISPR type III-B/RAMP module RAMP protein Cmr1 n=1 Tax=Thermoanaerobacter siderophilus SR4 TaxID=880478 RepID=I9AG47_9THEO|nr:type III-B CRISPR module RAMP protein Cmr1 [Thermoanaerobacter siderophilus]EIW00992.1 CRISPR type III-B/RAMP module RAMP protein Cmr1 [Thermoanaerobacter siderophilus SR4]
MSKKEVTVRLETITPLWTGDAWQENVKIRSSSLMGSLRFWFEIFLMAATDLLPSTYDYNSEKLGPSKYRQDILSNLNKGLTMKEAEIEAFKFQKISLPSFIFGCNGLKSKIEIENITYDDNLLNNELDLPFAIYKNKRDKEFIEVSSNDKQKLYEIRKNRNNHIWYFPQEYLYGDFYITFSFAYEDLAEKIFYPLLNFIQQYGFIGGKNNLGFGRVKFTIVDGDLSKYRTFDFSDFDYGKKYLYEAFEENTSKFEDMYDIYKIGFYKKGEKNFVNSDLSKKHIKQLIKELLSDKAFNRAAFKKNNPNEVEKRHFLFGISKGNINATKIIPWINKVDDTKYEYGYISLVMLNRFEQKAGVKNV